MQIQHIPLKQIKPDPNNPRGKDKTGIKELAQSIEENGLINPITVRPGAKDTFIIIAGHRRFEALKLNGCDQAPCIVREGLPDNQYTQMQLIENLQRQDINPMDEARGIQSLIDTGMQLSDVKLKLGKSIQFLYGRTRLLQLIPEIQEDVRSGWLPLSCAIIIAEYDADMQEAIYKKTAYESHWEGNGNYSYEKDEHWELTTTELRNKIQSQFVMMLERAPFKIDDDTFDGGSCNSCQKNTSANNNLFSDVADEERLGRCLDSSCWNNKCVQHVQRIVEKSKVKPIYITQWWESKTIEPYGEVIGHNSYETHSKGCTSKETGIEVEGSTIGKVIKICRDTTCPIHGRSSRISGSANKSPDALYSRKIEIINQQERALFITKVLQRLWLASPDIQGVQYILDSNIDRDNPVYTFWHQYTHKLNQWMPMMFIRVIAMSDNSRLGKLWNIIKEVDTTLQQFSIDDNPYLHEEIAGFLAWGPQRLWLKWLTSSEPTIDKLLLLLMASSLHYEPEGVLRSSDNEFFLNNLPPVVNKHEIAAEIAQEFQAKRDKLTASFEKNHKRKPILDASYEVEDDN